MQDFKNMKSTLLLCTPEVERGLDMPGVDYVYSLDAPSTAASYLHRAGRCGRLGATSSGVVTSVVTAEEERALDQALLDLEIRGWESLEEQKNEPSVMSASERAALDEGAEGAEEAPTRAPTRVPMRVPMRVPRLASRWRARTPRRRRSVS